MRIDPKDTIGGLPALVVRKTLRHLRDWPHWKLANLEAAAALPPGSGHALLKALRAEALIEADGTGA
jgi:hypothetical protein